MVNAEGLPPAGRERPPPAAHPGQASQQENGAKHHQHGQICQHPAQIVEQSRQLNFVHVGSDNIEVKTAAGQQV